MQDLLTRHCTRIGVIPVPRRQWLSPDMTKNVDWDIINLARSADNRLSTAKSAADNRLSAVLHAADNQLQNFPINQWYCEYKHYVVISCFD